MLDAYMAMAGPERLLEGQLQESLDAPCHTDVTWRWSLPPGYIKLNLSLERFNWNTEAFDGVAGETVSPNQAK